ncbi:hypothetical protein BJ508DRAFT_314496 [Ascobolus immersus RN42]|uniref:Uncharacterized protein n=1 Tax=Ascobolus immersus RN42 TaxID=1160509 RepID=A0A3N4HKN8_ASCIM|nr:hypothetical protein BJ508DRAFT_314496 [Ascobolus immersus RN42]
MSLDFSAKAEQVPVRIQLKGSNVWEVPTSSSKVRNMLEADSRRDLEDRTVAGILKMFQRTKNHGPQKRIKQAPIAGATPTPTRGGLGMHAVYLKLHEVDLSRTKGMTSTSPVASTRDRSHTYQSRIPYQLHAITSSLLAATLVYLELVITTARAAHQLAWACAAWLLHMSKRPNVGQMRPLCRLTARLHFKAPSLHMVHA